MSLVTNMAEQGLQLPDCPSLSRCTTLTVSPISPCKDDVASRPYPYLTLQNGSDQYRKLSHASRHGMLYPLDTQNNSFGSTACQSDEDKYNDDLFGFMSGVSATTETLSDFLEDVAFDEAQFLVPNTSPVDSLLSAINDAGTQSFSLGDDQDLHCNRIVEDHKDSTKRDFWPQTAMLLGENWHISSRKSTIALQHSDDDNASPISPSPETGKRLISHSPTARVDRKKELSPKASDKPNKSRKTKRVSFKNRDLSSPIQCDSCDAVFIGQYQRSNLARHHKTKHSESEARFKCQRLFCPAVYKRADALRKHEWKKHRMEGSRPEKRKERLKMPDVKVSGS